MKKAEYHARLRPFIEPKIVAIGGTADDPMTFADLPEVPNDIEEK